MCFLIKAFPHTSLLMGLSSLSFNWSLGGASPLHNLFLWRSHGSEGGGAVFFFFFFFFLSAEAKRPLHRGLKLAISAWARGDYGPHSGWATSSPIISHNVSTHGISQVVGCASGRKDAADTSLHCDINFRGQSSERGLFFFTSSLQLHWNGRVFYKLREAKSAEEHKTGDGFFMHFLTGDGGMLLRRAEHKHEHGCWMWPWCRRRRINAGNLSRLISKRLFPRCYHQESAAIGLIE